MESKIDLQPALKLLGEQMVAKIVEVLVRKDKVVTGKLRGSITSQVVTIVDNLNYQLSILDDSGYFLFQDEGRPPGKMPPVSKIEKWTKLRGIDIKYAYPIAVNIGKFGLPPNHIFDDAIKEFDLKPFENSLEEIYFKQISEQIIASFKDRDI